MRKWLASKLLRFLRHSDELSDTDFISIIDEVCVRKLSDNIVKTENLTGGVILIISGDHSKETISQINKFMQKRYGDDFVIVVSNRENSFTVARLQ